jgi:citrate synthase
MSQAPASRGFLSSAQAAGELGVKLSTIYAYVSRGLLRSVSGDARRHLYAAEDVRALKARRDQLRGGAGTRPPASDNQLWNVPILDSELCLIIDGQLYYRGVDAVRLAGSATLEQTASLLWGCPDISPFTSDDSARLEKHVLAKLSRLSLSDPLGRAIVALNLANEADEASKAKTTAGRWAVGARILSIMTTAITGEASRGPMHKRLAAAWAATNAKAADILRSTLVACAEHELNVSAFTVRCVASTGATPYQAVAAGLCALAGPHHGGATRASERLLDEIERGIPPREAVQNYLNAGLSLPGFGHRLYPSGDPRAESIIAKLKSDVPKNATLVRALELLSWVERAAKVKPNIDMALALVARVLDLQKDSAICLFALGRAAGWIAHAIEQYETRTQIRPRARYVGPPPKEKL